jgi:hypothetical protein
MGARPIIAGILFACAIAALAGCGDSDSDSEDTTATTAVAETTDPPAKLPRGWTTTVNEAGGYSIGVPPGWSERQSAAKTTLRAPGSPVVVSVTADRSDEALEADLRSFAEDVATEIGDASYDEFSIAGGFEYAGASPYEIEGVLGRGGRDQGVPQRVQVVIVRRPDLAAYPMVVVSDIKVKPLELNKILLPLIGSLRGRPVALGG